MVVASCVREILGTMLVPGVPLMAAGVDSLGATELQRLISARFRMEVLATLLFDHPSVESISALVANHLGLAFSGRKSTSAMCFGIPTQIIALL
ncbi:acyl carrier protein [bacterium]|nr:acyl carrier protein [bacterium]